MCVCVMERSVNLGVMGVLGSIMRELFEVMKIVLSCSCLTYVKSLQFVFDILEKLLYFMICKFYFQRLTNIELQSIMCQLLTSVP